MYWNNRRLNRAILGSTNQGWRETHQGIHSGEEGQRKQEMDQVRIIQHSNVATTDQSFFAEYSDHASNLIMNNLFISEQMKKNRSLEDPLIVLRSKCERT